MEYCRIIIQMDFQKESVNKAATLSNRLSRNSYWKARIQRLPSDEDLMSRSLALSEAPSSYGSSKSETWPCQKMLQAIFGRITSLDGLKALWLQWVIVWCFASMQLSPYDAVCNPTLSLGIVYDSDDTQRMAVSGKNGYMQVRCTCLKRAFAPACGNPREEGQIES